MNVVSIMGGQPQTTPGLASLMAIAVSGTAILLCSKVAGVGRRAQPKVMPAVVSQTSLAPLRMPFGGPGVLFLAVQRASVGRVGQCTAACWAVVLTFYRMMRMGWG